jgi:hypothetical protein
VVDHALRLVVGAQVDAGDVNVFHQVENGAPAGRVEAMLQWIVRLVTAGAIVLDDLFQPLVVAGRVRQRCHGEIAGQLAKIVAAQRRQRKILMAVGGECERAGRGRKRQRLRPHPVSPIGQDREVVVAAIVREHGGDGTAAGLGRDCNAAHRLAGGRFDRPAQEGIGERRRGRENRGSGGGNGEARNDGTTCIAHVLLHPVI